VTFNLYQILIGQFNQSGWDGLWSSEADRRRNVA